MEPKISDWPQSIIPADARVIVAADFYDDVLCVVKGFYDRNSGVLHIQETQEARMREGWDD